ncbi:MAG: hypothetical protein Kow00121_44720 [Elainellaceae cyanobacterium]
MLERKNRALDANPVQLLDDSADKLNASARRQRRASAVRSLSTLTEREPNNSEAQAQFLGSLARGSQSESRSISRASIGSSQDRLDFYSLEMGRGGNLDVSVIGGNRPTVSVYFDRNRNNRIDFGEFIDSNSGSIDLEGLDDGRYFVRLAQFSSSTKVQYDMHLTATPGAGRESEPNDGRFAADKLGGLLGFRSMEGSISSRDRQDNFSFRLANTKSVGLSFSDPSFRSGIQTTMQLFKDTNRNGFVDSNEQQIAVSNRAGANQSIQRSLTSGDYIVRINQVVGDINRYQLNLSAL